MPLPGLARFCSEPYEAPGRHNLGNVFMHLTNTAVNRRNQLRVANSTVMAGDGGARGRSKWSLAMLR
jgi:tubulin polyglutamylase TTLL6/13